jgi:hypothetical protein
VNVRGRLVAIVLVLAACSAPQPAPPPPDPDAAATEPGVLPEGALGRGEGKVVLACVDGNTGAPMAADLRLWRLGVAPGDGFTAGDQVQRVLSVPADGMRVDGLPLGAYRVEDRLIPVDADDPPAFDVTDTERAVRLVLPRTRPHPVRLVLFDDAGRRIEQTGKVRILGDSEHGADGCPPWSRPRVPEGAPPATIGYHRRVLARGRPRDFAETLTAAADGTFDLGSAEQATRDDSVHEFAVVETSAGRAEVFVTLGERGATEPPLRAAVAADLTRLAAHVHLPDGRLATDAGARVTGSVHSEPSARAAEALGAARRCLFDLSVELEGYETYGLKAHLDDPARAPVVLVPRASRH